VETLPYIVFVGSHKGGSGRTTVTLALAWLWGQAGRLIAVVDADPVSPGIGPSPGSTWDWTGVRFVAGLANTDELLGCDLVLIDGPLLGEWAAKPLLRLADGVLLTCAAEPLGVRTLTSALGAVQRAQESNPALSLLGVCVQQFQGSDRMQVQLRGLLWRRHGTYVLEPAVPHQAELAEWLLHPCRPLPEGPARQAFVRLAARLEPALGCIGAVSALARCGHCAAPRAVPDATLPVHV
jgi:cellulose biosynthesis protein BcsQ